MHALILIVALLDLGGTVFLILRKPRVVGVIAPKPEGHHRICGECKREVARYTPREDGSVVCLNCKPLEG